MHNPQEVYPPRRAIRNRHRGVVVFSSTAQYIAEALTDTLHHAGYATVWRRPSGPKTIVRGAIAGIWDGGQLDDRDTDDLAAFCRQLARDASPVIALLDFPRSDRVEVARQLGAAGVLGKPWINTDLIAVIEQVANCDAIESTTIQHCAA